MVGRLTLDQKAQVRILYPQPLRSWRIRLAGLGHIPLKDEITGSNPVCATTTQVTLSSFDLMEATQ